MVSEVFIDVWRQAERFERRCQVSTWLLAIARNKALSSLRRRSNEQLDDEVAEFIEDPADNPEVSMQKQERSEILRSCLTRAVAGAPRDHRPRLLPRAVDRGGLRDHRRAGQHREDPHVLCPQADRRDDGGPRHRALRDLGFARLFPAQAESGEVPPKRGTSCFVTPADWSANDRLRAGARAAPASRRPGRDDPVPGLRRAGHRPLLRRHLRAAGSGRAAELWRVRDNSSMSERSACRHLDHRSARARQHRGAGARRRPPRRAVAVARPRRHRLRRDGGAHRRRRLSRAAAAAARHRREHAVPRLTPTCMIAPPTSPR